MNLKKISLFLLLTLITTSGFGCTKSLSSSNSVLLKPVTLQVWGVYEDEGNLRPLFDAFKKDHPTVSFAYRKFEASEYEKQLLDAWAEDRGPDIYFLPNNSIAKYKTKITPLPEKIKLPYQQIKETGIANFKKKDVINSVKELKTISLNDLIANYPDVVSDDVVLDNKIYGLPLSIETMAMFYNKGLLNNANISLPPKNWDDFADNVKQISIIDEKKEKFVQSGTALGTTKNISNSANILILLMQQSDINITRDNNSISFGTSDEERNKALSAIEFYTDFANPIKEVYSWNDSESDSLEAFIAGKVGFYFGYPHSTTQIKARAPRLNFGITKVPQIKGDLTPASYANYWVMTVSHKTKSKDIAWGFIDFATQKENAKLYLDKTKKPTALRDLIDTQKKDPELSAFADQILTAKSWYHGNRPDLADSYLKEMIETIKTTSLDIGKRKDLLNFTASKINQDIK